MNGFLTLIGLVMIYSWVHLIVIIFSKLFKKCTTYEKVVICVGLVGFALYVLGTI